MSALINIFQEDRATRWVNANREALETYNDYLEAHGLPLERQRLF